MRTSTASRSDAVGVDPDRAGVLRHGDFTLGDEQRALREAFASFLVRECPSERVRAAEPLGFDDKLWRRFVEMRAVAMGVPAGDGGDGAGLVELALVAEEVGAQPGAGAVRRDGGGARLLCRCGLRAGRGLTRPGSGSQLISIALRPLRPGRPQLVSGGAVADAVVGLLDDEVVMVTSPTPFEPVGNHGLAPLTRLDVGDAGMAVTSIGSGAAAREAFGTAGREWQLLMAAAQVGIAAGALRPAVEFASNSVAFRGADRRPSRRSPIRFRRLSYIGLVGARRLVLAGGLVRHHEPDANRQLIRRRSCMRRGRRWRRRPSAGVHTLGGLGFSVVFPHAGRASDGQGGETCRGIRARPAAG